MNDRGGFCHDSRNEMTRNILLGLALNQPNKHLTFSISPMALRSPIIGRGLSVQTDFGIFRNLPA